MINFSFFNSDTDETRKIKKEGLRLAFSSALTMGKDFVVEIKSDKTSKQLRGFYRICGILSPYMAEAEGIFFDKDMVKEYVKQECNYCVVVRGKMITKSISKATKEEMRILIDKLYELGSFFAAKDYKLTSHEVKALIEYYNKI